MNNLTISDDFQNVKYQLKQPEKNILSKRTNLFLSVSSGHGTYSCADTVEIAIMFRNDDTFDFCYDMTGGDVVGWFPKDKVQGFIDWFDANCDTPGFFVNVNGSNRNLPDAFLNDPDRGSIIPRYSGVPIIDY